MSVRQKADEIDIVEAEVDTFQELDPVRKPQNRALDSQHVQAVLIFNLKELSNSEPRYVP